MEKIVISGRKCVGGYAEGEAIVTTQSISGWGGIDALTGVFIDSSNELCGQSFAGKVLVFRGASGSSGWSYQFHIAREVNCQPCALLYVETTTKAAQGAVVMGIPAMTDFDQNPTEIIRTGDYVKVFADEGRIEVYRD